MSKKGSSRKRSYTRLKILKNPANFIYLFRHFVALQGNIKANGIRNGKRRTVEARNSTKLRWKARKFNRGCKN